MSGPTPTALKTVGFSEIADELRLIARFEASTNEVMEEFIARSPNTSHSLPSVLADRRRGAELLGAAEFIIRMLCKHEEAARALIGAPREPSTARRSEGDENDVRST